MTRKEGFSASVGILKRCEGYCGTLYKNQDGDADNNRLDQRSDYEREPPPQYQMWTWVLGNIGNAKAPGMDDIPIELWKAAGEEGVDILWRACKVILTNGEWKKNLGAGRYSFHSRRKEISRSAPIDQLSHNKPHSRPLHANKVLLKIVIGRIKLRQRDGRRTGWHCGRKMREQNSQHQDYY